MYLTDTNIVASYNKADDVACGIIAQLGENETQVGYAVLGLALAIARLVHIDSPLTVDEEVQFTKDLTEWSGMYWGAGKDKMKS